MRTYSEITIDSETGEVLHRTVRHEDYRGPVDLAKGDAAKNAALQNASTGQSYANTLFGQGQSDQATLLPFLEGEITNPQGLGQPTMNAMTTAGGQSASGATANAAEQARLRAARTGNLGGESAIIANAARSGANAQSGANLKAQLADAAEKMKQQQAGASGLSSLGGADLKDALASLGLSNEAVNAWSGANKSAGNLWSNVFGPLVGKADYSGGGISGIGYGG